MTDSSMVMVWPGKKIVSQEQLGEPQDPFKREGGHLDIQHHYVVKLERCASAKRRVYQHMSALLHELTGKVSTTGFGFPHLVPFAHNSLSARFFDAGGFINTQRFLRVLPL